MKNVTTVVDTPQQGAVARTIASQLNRADGQHCTELNHLVERMGETVILLSSYMSYRLEDMRDHLNGMHSGFSMKLSNRTNHIIRACDDFAKVMEPYINTDDRRKAYSWYSDIIFNALDSLLDDMHRDYPEPTAQIIRRAKLRYHDPYPTDVKERTAAFEDGYCKGYIDAMEDFIREVASMSDSPNIQVHVKMEEGKIKLIPA